MESFIDVYYIVNYYIVIIKYGGKENMRKGLIISLATIVALYSGSVVVHKIKELKKPETRLVEPARYRIKPIETNVYFHETGVFSDGTLVGKLGALVYILDEKGKPISPGFHSIEPIGGSIYIGTLGARSYTFHRTEKTFSLLPRNLHHYDSPQLQDLTGDGKSVTVETDRYIFNFDGTGKLADGTPYGKCRGLIYILDSKGHPFEPGFQTIKSTLDGYVGHTGSESYRISSEGNSKLGVDGKLERPSQGARGF